ncbi:MAG TPA: hypothetical protein VJH21_02950 [Candidatus Paceibacterota bacterium]
MKFSFTKQSFSFSLRKLFLRRKEQLTYPYRDWGILILACASILSLLVVWSTYLFFSIKDGQSAMVSTTTEASGGKTIDRTILHNVLDFQTAREDRFNELIDNPPKLRNPAR